MMRKIQRLGLAVAFPAFSLSNHYGYQMSEVNTFLLTFEKIDGYLSENAVLKNFRRQKFLVERRDSGHCRHCYL